MEGLKSWFGVVIKDGEFARRMFKIPICQRKCDGVIFSPGCVVNFGGKVFLITDVCVSNDLDKVNFIVFDLSASPASIREEIVLAIDEVIPIPIWKLADNVATLSKAVAEKSMQHLISTVPCYPPHVKRMVRKYILVAKIRNYIKSFLEGLEMVGKANLGSWDWDHDAATLGLSTENPRLQYRIEEDGVDNGDTKLVDILLGPKWDLVDSSSTMGNFRIIITLEVGPQSNGDIVVEVHAWNLAQKPDPDRYRAQFLENQLHFMSNVMSASECRTQLLMQTPNTDITNKLTLTWESFNPRATLNPRSKDQCVSTPIVAEATSTTPENDKATATSSTTNVTKERDGTFLSSSVTKSTIDDGSSCHSIASTMASSAASRLRLQGFFQESCLLRGDVVQQCPFPNDWQYGTVPEVVTNDDDVD